MSRFRIGFILLVLLLSLLSSSIIQPFQQSQRESAGCCAICFGYLQSFRQIVSLFGWYLVGYISDKYGRVPTIFLGLSATICTNILSAFSFSPFLLFVSIIPSALLNKNYLVVKSMILDGFDIVALKENQQNSSLGWLGVILGLSMILGPLVGYIGESFIQCLAISSIFATLAFVIVLLFLREGSLSRSNSDQKTSLSPLLLLRNRQFFYLFIVRFLMSLAYNVFIVPWNIYLTNVFHFKPRDHSRLLSWIGFCYALGQGYLSPIFIRTVGDSKILVLICICILCIGRMAMTASSSLLVIYAIQAMVIISLGSINIIYSRAAAGIDIKRKGEILGLLEMSESMGSIFGPICGGYLCSMGSNSFVYVYSILYGLVFIIVYFQLSFCTRSQECEAKKD